MLYAMAMPTDSDWYRHAVIYQIYPRSYKDSNGDGVGDLEGIIQKLDYLENLGVDAIWLSPIYQSPMADFGYDVSDYQTIDPIFGELETFDRLIAAAHKRNIKVLMDLIANHTSDEHIWFKESRASITSPKRDWYIWKPPRADGGPPNNWQSAFGGTAWKLDPTTGQYYLFSFLSAQPDLNWANPEVRNAIQDIMRFWYGRGVDGFRVDAILFTSKDLSFADSPIGPGSDQSTLTNAYELAFAHKVGEHIPEYVRVLSEVTKEYPGRCLFLEAYPEYAGPQGYAKLYDYFDVSVTAMFYFGMLGMLDSWSVGKFNEVVVEFMDALPPHSIPVPVLGNHDIPRLASRVSQQTARAVAVMFLTLPGTKFVYYGEELGMKNVVIPPDERQDPRSNPRDGQRTPMPWSADENAGFTSGRPWLTLNPDYTHRNVEVQMQDSTSFLNLYRHLIGLVRQHSALRLGDFVPLTIADSRVGGFRRDHQQESVVVLINFSDTEVMVAAGNDRATLLLSSYGDTSAGPIDMAQLTLRPYEAVALGIS
jgi:alpha-glucosidase